MHLEIVLPGIYIVTMLITIINMIKLIGLIFGNDINIPPLLGLKVLTVTSINYFLPSLGYQIYLWSAYLNII